MIESLVLKTDIISYDEIKVYFYNKVRFLSTEKCRRALICGDNNTDNTFFKHCSYLPIDIAGKFVLIIEINQCCSAFWLDRPVQLCYDFYFGI